jgi:hypothetical protein
MRAPLLVLILVLCAGSLAAQSSAARVLVHVDYITERSLYISAGAAQGLFAGDTAVAYPSGGQQPLGRVVIASSTRSRAVALMLDSLGIGIGDVLELAPPQAAVERARAAALARADSAKAGSAEGGAVVPPVQVRSSRPRSQNGVLLRGRLGLDFDALMTESNVGAGDSLTQRFTYTTPAARLRANLSGLPGGMRLNTNMRLQYFGGPNARGEQLSVRVYQASVERADSRVRFQLGRFYNPYESHSGYWDGALLRLGGDAVGGGVAVGYTPLAGSDGFSSAYPKTTAFIDLHHRSRNTRYDGSASFHEQTSEFTQGKRTLLGFSQHLGLYGFSLTQRAQVGRTPEEAWSLWQMQSSLSVNIGRPLQLFGRYSAERTALFSQQPGASPLRVRWTGGLSASVGGAYAAAEGGRISEALGSAGQVYQGSLIIPRALLGVGFSINGSRWEEPDVVSTYVSPALDRSFGSVRAHLGAQYNNSVFQGTRFLQRGAELSLAIPIARRAEAMITAAQTRSSGSTSTRILTSIWQSF